MALTESTMLELGTTAPDFALTDVVTGKTVRRDDFRGSKGAAGHVHLRPLPLCEAHREEAWPPWARITPASLSASSPSAATTRPRTPPTAPPDSSSRLKHSASTFPILYDETQAVARAYKAACTPDFFLFDENFRLVYRGQFDSRAAPATASPSPAKTCAPPST
jgi:hypothetical protein